MFHYTVKIKVKFIVNLKFKSDFVIWKKVQMFELLIKIIKIVNDKFISEYFWNLFNLKVFTLLPNSMWIFYIIVWDYIRLILWNIQTYIKFFLEDFLIWIKWFLACHIHNCRLKCALMSKFWDLAKFKSMQLKLWNCFL